MMYKDMNRETRRLLMKEIRRFKKETGVHITTAHTGKMSGMLSLSTSCTVNPFCLARMKMGAGVCAHCYADALQDRYPTLKAALVHNSEILSKTLVSVDAFPFLFGLSVFRLESFGDLINVTHARNYIRFCKRNPSTVFALWTKNPNLLETAYRLEGGKPANLVTNRSSLPLNKAANIDPRFQIDHIFTVYDKRSAATVEINCGARSCATCLRCYRKYGDLHISEKLK